MKVVRGVYTSTLFQGYQRIVMLQVVNKQFFLLELFITLRPPSKNIIFNSKDVKLTFILASSAQVLTDLPAFLTKVEQYHVSLLSLKLY